VKFATDANEAVRRASADALVIIDGSNVAGDTSIPGCGKFCWGRVESLQQIWRRENHPATEFLVVVDESLAPQLGAHCKATSRNARSFKSLQIVRFADSEILRNAELHDAVVLSRDF
jgi:hypothetical protein